jgi:hypothetical protein
VMPRTQNLYASPRRGLRVEDCIFYHTMELPGIGLVEGPWDLRAGVRDYLGGVELAGKRVLEMGTASGFLCFSMEAMGAEVVAYDLSHEQDWDIVPFADQDSDQTKAARRDQIRRLNNGWWLAHEKLGSRARVVYGSIYDVPADIGPVDVVTYGAILRHLRDPFLALQAGLRLARETVIVTDGVPGSPEAEAAPNTLRFVPNPATRQPSETWWSVPPSTVQRMIGVLGFDSKVTYHEQVRAGLPVKAYTVLGRRMRGRTQ